MNYVIVTCPHCEDPIYIDRREFNCRIFRHGVYKHNHTQIPPHLNKLACQTLIERGLIYGCGKPFRLVNTTDGVSAISCDYL